MADWSEQGKQAFVEALRAGAADLSESLGQAFERECQVDPAGDPIELSPNELWAGPGLLLLWEIEDGGSLVGLIPEIEGLLPTWYREPDGAQRSKLAALAQQLALLLLPAEFELRGFQATAVNSLEAALQEAEPVADAFEVVIPWESAGERGKLYLLGPVARTDFLPETAPSEELAADDGFDLEEGLRKLPSYMRSLLRIRVPVRVTLATARHPVQKILELGPGALLQFDKSCEDTLDLYVGGRRIGVGEAVKVGDKFGLRITSIVLPEERFRVVGGSRGN